MAKAREKMSFLMAPGWVVDMKSDSKTKACLGYPTSVLHSAAARRLNIIRCLYLSPKNNNPRILLVIRTDHTRVLTITKEFACSALIIKKWETIEVRDIGEVFCHAGPITRLTDMHIRVSG
jgi:hypothetical protein